MTPFIKIISEVIYGTALGVAMIGFVTLNKYAFMLRNTREYNAHHGRAEFRGI